MCQNGQEMRITKVTAPEAGADVVLETRRGASSCTQMSLPICAVIINSRSSEDELAGRTEGGWDEEREGYPC